MAPITFGIDHFLQTPPDKNKRWGLVTNDAVFTRGFIPVRQALLNHGLHLVRLFSPEHGLQVVGADGALMAHQTDVLCSVCTAITCAHLLKFCKTWMAFYLIYPMLVCVFTPISGRFPM